MNLAPLLASDPGEGWFVYIWQRGTEMLYVGQSNHVLRRLGGHHVINKIDRVQPTDCLAVESFDTADEMNRRERDLIYRFKPRYNQIGKTS